MIIKEMPPVVIGNKFVGSGKPVYIIAEIGINHNGSLELAKRMIHAAVEAGCDAVKFQKRTPELCVPRDQWNIERDTPWGRITYLEYRHKVELTEKEYAEIDALCKNLQIQWTASCWDEQAVDFMEVFAPPFYKVPSAALTDHHLLVKLRSTGRPIMLSTGMSTLDEIQEAINVIGTDNLMLAHATSTYPCPVEELNLRMLQTLQEMYPGVPIGYSGHETGLATTYAAVALGATFIERHITLDRAMWGTDQAASIEKQGLIKLVQDIRDIEKALGDGVKRVYDSELSARQKLRRVQAND